MKFQDTVHSCLCRREWRDPHLPLLTSIQSLSRWHCYGMHASISIIISLHPIVCVAFVVGSGETNPYPLLPQLNPSNTRLFWWGSCWYYHRVGTCFDALPSLDLGSGETLTYPIPNHFNPSSGGVDDLGQQPMEPFRLFNILSSWTL